MLFIENKEWFENHFPADFIVEALDQTRGWFYTLHVLGTALHHTNAFKTCVCTGLIMAEDGQKLSKRLKNYPDHNIILDSMGSDALRWWLMSSPVVKGGTTNLKPGVTSLVPVLVNVQRVIQTQVCHY